MEFIGRALAASAHRRYFGARDGFYSKIKYRIGTHGRRVNFPQRNSGMLAQIRSIAISGIYSFECNLHVNRHLDGATVLALN